MKKILALSLVTALAASLAACNTPAGQNSANGAVIGGGAGALFGAAATGNANGALIGGLAGATVGALVGANSAPQQPGYAPPPRACAQWYYDYYGNRVCRSYY